MMIKDLTVAKDIEMRTVHGGIDPAPSLTPKEFAEIGPAVAYNYGPAALIWLAASVDISGK